jgi:hypothetical protein
MPSVTDTAEGVPCVFDFISYADPAEVATPLIAWQRIKMNSVAHIGGLHPTTRSRCASI